MNYNIFKLVGTRNPLKYSRYVIVFQFVERRRAALERYLNRTSTYSSLRTDPDFREFLEVEAELPRAHQTATISGRTVMRLITKAADSLTR